MLNERKNMRKRACDMTEVNTQQMWQEIVILDDKIKSEGQKGSEGNQELLNQWMQEKKDLEDLIAESEKADRAQQIEEKVASIELPYDFNDLYETSTANATIIEIVQQFKRQDLVEHNAEIEKLTQLHKEQMSEQMRAANDRESQLQRQNKELQNDLQENVAAQKATEEENASLKLQLKEANFTKDNAATQLEEANAEIARLKSHIDDLVKEQAVGAREAHKVIETNQTLNELIAKTNEEKQAKIKSSAELAAEGALGFRGKVTFQTTHQQEQPFRSEDSINHPADAGNNQVLDTENEDVKAPQFQTVSVTGPFPIPMADSPSSSDRESGETPATQEWVKSQLAALEARITGENAA